MSSSEGKFLLLIVLILLTCEGRKCSAAILSPVPHRNIYYPESSRYDSSLQHDVDVQRSNNPFKGRSIRFLVESDLGYFDQNRGGGGGFPGESGNNPQGGVVGVPGGNGINPPNGNGNYPGGVGGYPSSGGGFSGVGGGFQGGHGNYPQGGGGNSPVGGGCYSGGCGGNQGGNMGGGGRYTGGGGGYSSGGPSGGGKYPSVGSENLGGGPGGGVSYPGTGNGNLGGGMGGVGNYPGTGGGYPGGGFGGGGGFPGIGHGYPGNGQGGGGSYTEIGGGYPGGGQGVNVGLPSIGGGHTGGGHTGGSHTGGGHTGGGPDASGTYPGIGGGNLGGGSGGSGTYPGPGVGNPGPGVGNPGQGVGQPGPGVGNPGPGVGNPGPGVGNPGGVPDGGSSSSTAAGSFHSICLGSTTGIGTIVHILAGLARLPVQTEERPNQQNNRAYNLADSPFLEAYEQYVHSTLPNQGNRLLQSRYDDTNSDVKSNQFDQGAFDSGSYGNGGYSKDSSTADDEQAFSKPYSLITLPDINLNPLRNAGLALGNTVKKGLTPNTGYAPPYNDYSRYNYNRQSPYDTPELSPPERNFGLPRILGYGYDSVGPGLARNAISQFGLSDSVPKYSDQFSFRSGGDSAVQFVGPSNSPGSTAQGPRLSLSRLIQ